MQLNNSSSSQYWHHNLRSKVSVYLLSVCMFVLLGTFQSCFKLLVPFSLDRSECSIVWFDILVLVVVKCFPGRNLSFWDPGVLRLKTFLITWFVLPVLGWGFLGLRDLIARM